MTQRNAKPLQDDAAAEWVSVDDLVPWDRNPRRNDKAVPEVAASIRRFGFAAPIVARRADGMVIAGHTRLRAAQSLGLDRVPVRWMDLDVTDAQLLALADNKVGEIAEWDEDALRGILRDLDVGEATEGLGFDEEELRALLGTLDEMPEPETGADEDVVRETWGVIVDCDSEHEQVSVMEHLEAGGFACRALIS